MLRVAVVGATGAVGQQLISILESRKFPARELVPFASARSQGKPVVLNGKRFPCEVLKPGCFQGVDIAFFDASDAISKEWVPQASESGAWVVDNSATFRLEPDIPLVVPEVNGDVLKGLIAQGRTKVSVRQRIVTGPNCSTVQLVVALKPIQDRWGIKRVVVSTYQSASGAGSAATTELADQTRVVLDGGVATAKAFVHPIPFNAIPQIGRFGADGATSEEEKIIAETRKLLLLPHLKISATAVRIPSFSCHGESVNVECERSFDLEKVRIALTEQAGIVVQDDPAKSHYPMGAVAAHQDPVFVGRVRRDLSVDNGLNLWVVSDNLRKGAALNAVQIGEILLDGLQ